MVFANQFHWSRFKGCSGDTFFSCTFDLLLINSSKFFLFEKFDNDIKESCCFNAELKISYQQFLFFTFF